MKSKISQIDHYITVWTRILTEYNIQCSKGECVHVKGVIDMVY